MFIPHIFNSLSDVSTTSFSSILHTLQVWKGKEFRNIAKFCLNLITADVAMEVIKVDVAPSTSAVVHQSDSCISTNIIRHIPGLTGHCLGTFTSRGPNHLDFETNIVWNVRTLFGYSHKGEQNWGTWFSFSQARRVGGFEGFEGFGIFGRLKR